MPRLTPLQAFALKVLAWLPACFAAWYWTAVLWVWAPVQVARGVLRGLWPTLVSGVTLGADQFGPGGLSRGHANYLVQLATTIKVGIPGAHGAVGVLEPTLNPLVYGYALPLFAALALATPLSQERRLAQGAVALVVIWITQSFGLVGDALKAIAFDSGPAGAAAAAQAGLDLNAIALAYQFGYLILPAIVPAALWLAMNLDFIARLIGRAGEPGRPDHGQTAA